MDPKTDIPGAGADLQNEVFHHGPKDGEHEVRSVCID